MQLKKILILSVCSALVLVGCTVSAVTKSKSRKTPFEKMVAGYTVEKGEPVAFRDQRTGYYLIRTGHCDGAHIHLVLCVDLQSFSDDEWAFEPSQVKPGRLRNLQSGRGIQIGDASLRVRQVLGRPTWQGNSKYTRGEMVWSYHHQQGTQEDGVEYVTLFRFRSGRVTGIELNRDLLGAG